MLRIGHLATASVHERWGSEMARIYSQGILSRSRTEVLLTTHAFISVILSCSVILSVEKEGILFTIVMSLALGLLGIFGPINVAVGFRFVHHLICVGCSFKDFNLFPKEILDDYSKKPSQE